MQTRAAYIILAICNAARAQTRCYDVRHALRLIQWESPGFAYAVRAEFRDLVACDEFKATRRRQQASMMAMG